MRKINILTIPLLMLMVFISGFPAFAAPQDSPKNKVTYEPYKKDKALEEIEKLQEDLQKQKDDESQKIRDRQKAEKETEKKEKKVLKADLSGVYPPKSPAEFKQYFHFPSVPQYLTSTCWSFSTTSYFESEIYRLTGKKIKLSEMWAPYFELIEKCRRFIRERGESYVAGGAQSNSVIRIWKEHGIVPAEVFPGVINKEDRHNHDPLMNELDTYLEYIKFNNLWDEEENLKHVVLILNRYLGEPPKTFTYNGKTMTPLEFLQNETGLRLDDYYSLISTSRFPFYTYAEYAVPDNWWHNKDYINLPLDEWYNLIKKTIRTGHTLVIGGDVSEPGHMGEKDVAFIPTCDIPEKYIDQDSREFRINNKTSEDDHGVHIVGYTQYKGKDWFLIKDSSRAARKGKFEGYLFFRGDYIKLKMLTCALHKDLLKDILPKIKK
ncbi:MAG: bleomycin hydrolase [Acidobacteriota bacterium]|nr:bleomycin hydrolase [Acidobacteriota bacterium]